MSDVEYDVTYFKGPTFPLSNFYRADLFVFDRWFPSSEHAYQWRKASVCGNLTIANQILAAKSPPDAKRLVKGIRPGTRLGRSARWHTWHWRNFIMSRRIDSP